MRRRDVHDAKIQPFGGQAGCVLGDLGVVTVWLATQLLAVFVELSAWPAWLNLTRLVQTAAAQVNGAPRGRDD